MKAGTKISIWIGATMLCFGVTLLFIEAVCVAETYGAIGITGISLILATMYLLLFVMIKDITKN